MSIQKNRQLGKVHHRVQCSALTAAIRFAGIAMMAITVSNTVSAEVQSLKSYQVAAGNLSTSLNQFVEQAGTRIVVDAKQLQGLSSEGLQGRYTIEQGFAQILANTGYQAVAAGTGYVIVKDNNALPTQNSVKTSPNVAVSPNINTTTSQSEVIQLAPMVVYGIVDRDAKGYDDVYDADISSVYAGKEQIERYKGAQPADLFKGMVGVYSGDARNSGAIDPSIRGIQGPGRVPVIIDGTEQALTVWRGYNGANNRSYIDPNLIGGLQVIKGPSLTRNVNTGVGGAVIVSTLNVDDVLKGDKSFGGEFKVETSNNAVKARQPQLLTGQSIHDNPNYPAAGTYVWNGKKYWDLYYDPSLSADTRTDKENNIYSGDDVAARIALAGRTDHFEVLAAYAYRDKGNHFAGSRGSDFYNQEPKNNDDYVPYLSKIYPTGTEVTNTSLKTESYLVKGIWKPTDEHRLELGYRDTDVLHGEIFPSRIQWQTLLKNDASAPQWPLSHVNSKAYNMEYKYQPENNQWIDFYSNVWKTDTASQVYSSGGFPNFVNETLGIFTNTAIANFDNQREGITLSNKFQLLSNLNLTVGGSFQKEKLTSSDDYNDPMLYGNGSQWKMWPREGRREEKEFNFNFEVKPTSWLTLNAGARYNNYWSFDDFLNSRVEAGDTKFTKGVRVTGGKINYYTKDAGMTAEQEQIREQQVRQNYADYTRDYGFYYSEEQIDFAVKQAIYQNSHTVPYYMDSRGKYTVANNPLLNGSLQGVEYGYATSNLNSLMESVDLSETGVQKLKDHAWAPSLSATINFNPASRMYVRYSEAYRMPTLFETTIGFSSSQNRYGLEPEHAFNYEVAYIHDLSNLFNSAYADVKLAYYHNKTENVIERDGNLVFSNMDHQTKEGLELQSRFDNGRFFTDFSANYQFKNKVCDEHNAMTFGSQHNYQLNQCVDNGWVGGYLVLMATPKYSANWTIGGRFLDQKLELGTRASYFYKYENPHESNYGGRVMSFYASTPLSWDSTTIVDAYVNYRLKEDTLFELVGTNLTDEFYIDPLTRSALAAPGRTVKLSITHKF